jgi:hypothetical protein
VTGPGTGCRQGVSMLGVELFRRVTGRHALFRDARRRRAKHHLQMPEQRLTPDDAATAPVESSDIVSLGEETQAIIDAPRG